MSDYTIIEEARIEEASSALTIWDGKPVSPEASVSRPVGISNEPSIYDIIPPETIKLIPHDMVQVFHTFYDSPDGDMAKIIEIMTRGLHLTNGHPQYAETRITQAQDIQEHLIRVNANVDANIFLLGYMLYWIMNNELYAEIGYLDIDDLCLALNIHHDRKREALRIVKIYPLLELSGLAITEVMGGPLLYKVKVDALVGMVNNKTKELQAITKDVLKDLDLLPDTNDSTTAQSSHILLSAQPVETQKHVQYEVDYRYREKIIGDVREIAEKKPEDILKDRNERRGTPQPALIILRNFEWNGSIATFNAGSFICGSDEIAAMQKGQFQLRVQVATGSPLAPENPQEIISLKIVGDTMEIIGGDMSSYPEEEEEERY